MLNRSLHVPDCCSLVHMLAAWRARALRWAQPSPTLGMQQVLPAASPPRNLPPMTSPDLSPAMGLGDVAAPIGMRESAMATASVLIDGVQLGAVRCRNRSWTDGVKQQPVTTADWCGVVLRVRFSHNYLRRYRILSLGVAFRRSIKMNCAIRHL